jgi:hypothetical protein
MNFKSLKLELFYIRKAFFNYHNGWMYLYHKYWLAPKILKSNKVLEKPINQEDFSIHILTCHRDLVMTIWSLSSFYQVMDRIGQLYIHNDGSLSEVEKKTLKKFFPSSIVLDTASFLQDYEKEISEYPVLKHFRSTYNNFSFKKIIDPYFTSDKKFKLIIDSDLFWFRKPEEIEEQFSSDSHKSFMQSNNTLIHVSFKDGSKISDKLAAGNAGIIFYNKDNFSTDKFAEFLDRLDISNERNLHFVDQLGHAYSLNDLELLPKDNYIIKGEVNDSTVVRHYTSPRRVLFFTEGVKVLKNQLLKK